MPSIDMMLSTVAEEHDEDDGAPQHEGYTVVYVRMRPLDLKRGAEGGLTVDTARSEVMRGQEKFAYSAVFDGSQTNELLFDPVGRPLVDASLLGFNGTLMSYGQTGSGKTHTMGEIDALGTAAEGLGHRMVRDLFHEIAIDKRHSFAVKVLFVQVYMDKIYDLLSDDNHGSGPAVAVPLQLRESAKNGVYVEKATSVPAATADDVLDAMRRASRRLAFASTQMNLHSSRSHAVCQLSVTKSRLSTVAAPTEPISGEERAQLESPHKAERAKAWRRRSAAVISNVIQRVSTATELTRGKLTLVDLAGSEDVGRSGAAGTTLAEAKKINVSLLALGNVIQALTHDTHGGRAAHVPFRDSVLTRLLKESLGGNCKTTLLCCCSPAEADLKETVSTLRFGARAKRVRNHAKVNAAVEVTAIAESLALPALADGLQQQLDEAEAALAAERAALAALRAELEAARRAADVASAQQRAEGGAAAAAAARREAALREDVEALHAALDGATEEARQQGLSLSACSAWQRAGARAKLAEAQEEHRRTEAEHAAARAAEREAAAAELAAVREEARRAQAEALRRAAAAAQRVQAAAVAEAEARARAEERELARIAARAAAEAAEAEAAQAAAQAAHEARAEAEADADARQREAAALAAHELQEVVRRLQAAAQAAQAAAVEAARKEAAATAGRTVAAAQAGAERAQLVARAERDMEMSALQVQVDASGRRAIAAEEAEGAWAARRAEAGAGDGRVPKQDARCASAVSTGSHGEGVASNGGGNGGVGNGTSSGLHARVASLEGQRQSLVEGTKTIHIGEGGRNFYGAGGNLLSLEDRVRALEQQQLQLDDLMRGPERYRYLVKVGRAFIGKS